jgi:hypothetical protein
MRNEQLRQLDQPPLRDDEFYAARLYTGPMYLKYNAALRHKGMMNSDDAPASSKEHSEAQFQQLCMGNYYVSTLHAINSAVVKLGSEPLPTPVQTLHRSALSSAPSAPCALCTLRPVHRSV